MDCDPPFHQACMALLDQPNRDCFNNSDWGSDKGDTTRMSSRESAVAELPVIDIGRLGRGGLEGEQCKLEIARASQEWGFFQVVNHGISWEILEKTRAEQVALIKQPFERKSNQEKFLNFSPGSYRWGTPTATCLQQFSWSEAFHIPLSDILGSGSGFDGRSRSSTMEQFASTVSSLAQTLAEILAENMGRSSRFFRENCLPSTCYLRLNRYPPCPFPANVFGLMPHTDSDFLTVLHQDQVGGLQLVKDGSWISVKPNPQALIVNIGDLFQAWSNGVYKSVEHRVLTNPQEERFSIAYFFCPSYDALIESCCELPVYRKFSFREYREQVQADVRKYGSKIGLSRFLL